MTISNIWVRQTLPETLSAMRDVGGQPLLDAVRQSSLGENECAKLMIYDFFAFKSVKGIPQFAICGDEENGLSDLVLFVSQPYVGLVDDVIAVCDTLRSHGADTRLFLTDEQLVLLPGLG